MKKLHFFICSGTFMASLLGGKPLDDLGVNQLANAIFRAENSPKHPYGVMIPTENPRRVCCNTINHAWVDFMNGKGGIPTASRMSGDFGAIQCTLPFIQFLGRRYCPPSVDPIGYRNWTNNVWRIYNAKH